METKNEIQDSNEEDMFSYRFISIDAMHEEISIFDIVAGSEEDAFDIVSEDSESNTESCFLISDKMIKQLYDEIQKIKDIL